MGGWAGVLGGPAEYCTQPWPEASSQTNIYFSPARFNTSSPSGVRTRRNSASPALLSNTLNSYPRVLFLLTCDGLSTAPPSGVRTRRNRARAPPQRPALHNRIKYNRIQSARPPALTPGLTCDGFNTALPSEVRTRRNSASASSPTEQPGWPDQKR